MNLKKHLALTVVLLGALGLIATNLSRTFFSTPVRSVVERIESDPEVAKALGSPVSVALLQSYTLERYTLEKLRLDRQIAAAGLAGEDTTPLAIERQRVQAEISRRLV